MLSLCSILATIIGISLFTYLLPVLLQCLVYKEQDLKRKYGAEWALVTGGSSGIGRALVRKLAAQGLNVVVVALDDALLHALDAELARDYPGQRFVAVGADLSRPEAALAQVQEATEGLAVRLVFNNAGYLTFGLFADLPLARHLANLHVNCTTATLIAHHFAARMVEEGAPGCLVFTSSPAGQMPGPLASIYGATKAYLTNFATSLAAELRGDGVDVLVLHPSPVNTNFYAADVVAKSSSLAFFRSTATTPESIASSMLACVGRPFSVIKDQGYFSIGLQLLLKLVDFHMLAILMAQFMWLGSEYKGAMAERKARRAKQQ